MSKAETTYKIQYPAGHWMPEGTILRPSPYNFHHDYSTDNALCNHELADLWMYDDAQGVRRYAASLAEIRAYAKAISAKVTKA